MKKTCNKKGQVTTFIILGMILVMLIIGIIYFQTSGKKEVAKTTVQKAVVGDLTTESGNARELVDSCLKLEAKKGMQTLGQQGGYIDRPDSMKIQYTEDKIISYLQYEKSENIPSIETIEQGMSKYIDTELRYCLDDFDVLKERGYDVTITNPKTRVKVAESTIEIEVSFPIRVAKPGAEIKLEQFHVTYNVDFKKILNEVQKIIQEEKNGEEREKQTSENGMNIDQYQYENSNKKLWQIKQNNFEFYFATNVK